MIAALPTRWLFTVIPAASLRSWPAGSAKGWPAWAGTVVAQRTGWAAGLVDDGARWPRR